MVDKDVLGSAAQTVAQLMRPPTATIEPAAHLAAAAYLIKHHRASVLVVTTDRDHHPVAMISGEEVAHAIADGRDPERTRVRQVARQRPVTVDSRAAAADAARLMMAEGVQHLLVEDGERLVGILDLNEVCRAAPGTCGLWVAGSDEGATQDSGSAFYRSGRGVTPRPDGTNHRRDVG